MCFGLVLAGWATFFPFFCTGSEDSSSSSSSESFFAWGLLLPKGFWTGDLALVRGDFGLAFTAFFAFGYDSEDYYDYDYESESFLPFFTWATLVIFLDFWAWTLGVGACYDSSSESCFFLLFLAFKAGDFDLASFLGFSED